MKLLSQANQASNAISEKDVILLLGSTGCGKSTTIQYLCGSIMKMTMINDLKHIEAEYIINKALRKVKLSPKAKSETRFITPILINLLHLGHPNEEFVTLVDSPGSEDTESKEVDISNGIGVINALSQAKSVKPIILISWYKIGPR